MKQHHHISIVVFLFWLFSCNSPVEKTEKEVVSSDITLAASTKTELTTKEKDLWNDCVRGRAKPIIKKSVFPKTKFTLQSDSLTAIETVDFDNGDKLIIQNKGCEYYSLIFRFETSRFQADTKNIPYWYKKLVVLVSELYKGLDAPINIKKGVNQLVNYIDDDLPHDYVNLKLEQEIDFGGDEIRSFVILESIEKLEDKKFAVTISFTTGPL